MNTENKELKPSISLVGSKESSRSNVDSMIEKEQLRVALQNTGISFMSSFTDAAFGLKDDIPYSPVISPNVLLDDVANDPILSHCISFKAKTVGGLGYHIKHVAKSLSSKDETLEDSRKRFNETCKDMFFSSLNSVAERAFYDFEYSGMGAIMIDTDGFTTGQENKNFLGKNYTVKYQRAIRVRHVNRLKIAVLQPRTNTKGEIAEDYRLDLMYPRMFVTQGAAINSGFYAQSFGDPRFINKKTGNVMSKWSNDAAPMIYRFLLYYPHDEIYGYPRWRSAKIDIDTLYDIRLCDHFYFRGNGVPNMVFIVPDVKTESGIGADKIVENFLEETSEQRLVLGGKAQRRAIVMSVPTGSIHQSSGKFPIMIKEIKGEPPGKNIELRNELNQSIINANELPSNLIVPYTKSVGSGKDKQEDLRQYKEFYAEPLRRAFNTEFLDVLFSKHTEFPEFSANLNAIDTSDLVQEALVAKVWDGINALNNGEKREKMGTTRPVNPSDPKKSKEFNDLIFIDFNRLPWNWENMERPDMSLKNMQQQLSDMEQQLKDAQAGVVTEEAQRFIDMCDQHGVPVEYLTNDVIPAITKYVNSRR